MTALNHFEKPTTKLPQEEAENIIREFKEKGLVIEEDAEYFIIPKEDENGKEKRVFIPKRYGLDIYNKETREKTRISIREALEKEFGN